LGFLLPGFGYGDALPSGTDAAARRPYLKIRVNPRHLRMMGLVELVPPMRGAMGKRPLIEFSIADFRRPAGTDGVWAVNQTRRVWLMSGCPSRDE